MKRAVAAQLLAVAALGAAAGAARADDDFRGAQIVYARGASLWKTDPRGKARPVELVALPAGGKAEDVRAIRADAAGHTLLVDLGGSWYWTHVDGDTATPLAAVGCGAGAASLALDGTCVVCADGRGKATIRMLGGDRHVDRDVPAAGAALVGAAGARALIWVDGGGVWSAPAATASASAAGKTSLAGEAPRAHFSASPDGTRGLGVYAAADEHGAELLYTFPLDGSGARRKSIRHGVPLEWSWDSQWVLVQDGGAGCVMRAVGGEYKCWRGYTAVGIAEDGEWALLLGPRDGKIAAAPAPSGKGKGKGAAKDASAKGKGGGKGKDAGKGKGAAKDKAAAAPADGGGGESGGGGGESGGGEAGEAGGPDGEGPDTGEGAEPAEGADAAVPDPTADEAPVALPRRPFALYRARRDGAYTDKPVLIVKDVDGPAAWLPAAPPPPPASPKSVPTPASSK